MAYNSKNMLKSKEFWIGFLVAVIVFVGLGELQRSNNRASAASDLSKTWASLTKDSERGAILVKTNTIMEQNKSWFEFSNSSANVDSGNSTDDKNYWTGSYNQGSGPGTSDSTEFNGWVDDNGKFHPFP